MLECSTQISPKLREGTEPATGLKVLFRKHFEIKDKNDTIIEEFWHGYVPE